MSASQVASSAGFFHEAGFYDSDDSLLAVVVPFIEAGLTAGEPVMVALGDRNIDLVRAALPDTAGVAFLPHNQAYLRPASTIKTFLELFRTHVEAIPGRLRLVGEVRDPTAQDQAWGPWSRYEAAVNAIYRDFPVSAMCAYNTQTNDDDALAEVERTHPYIATTGGGHLIGDRYEDPVAFLSSRPPPVPDPLEHGPPVLELLDPSPAAARQAVTDAAVRHTSLEHLRVGELVCGLSEVVTNAHLHGRPPVRVRGWAAADRLIVTIHDTGTGPANPFAGLVPAGSRHQDGGLGLWITHQMCSQVTHARSSDGFAIRLIAAAPQETESGWSPCSALSTEPTSTGG